MRFSDLLAAPTAIRLVALLGPALLAVPVLAQVDPGPASRGLVARVQKDSAAARVVSVEKQFEFGFVRIETREPGAELNSHPVRIEPAGLRAMLTEVQWSGAKPEQLFSTKELDQLVPPLSSALAHVTPEQEVSFAVSDQHSFMGPLASRVVTTGRVFRRDQALEIIFGLVRKDFESQFRGSGYLIAFEPGQRAKVVDPESRVALAASTGAQRRADWVALSLAAPAPLAAPAAAPAAASGAANPSTTSPNASATPNIPATAATPAPTPPAAARDADSIAKSIGERLKALQKLRDSGLISEAEYQERRRAILAEI